jgi:hypothetical protein
VGCQRCSYVKAGSFQGVEDDADEQSLEAADRFATAFAFGSLAFEICARGWVVARLSDRDSVERGVQLPVAAAVEPVTLHACGVPIFVSRLESVVPSGCSWGRVHQVRTVDL